MVIGPSLTDMCSLSDVYSIICIQCLLRRLIRLFFFQVASRVARPPAKVEGLLPAPLCCLLPL